MSSFKEVINVYSYFNHVLNKLSSFPKKKAIVDLHVHTQYSDGELSFERLLIESRSKAIDILSITDHNTIDGYIEACNLISNNPKIDEYPLILPGVELSTSFRNERVHINGLCFNPYSVYLEQILDKISFGHWERTNIQIDKLNKYGAEKINIETVKYIAKGRIPNWKIIAESLVASGDAINIKDAKERYMNKNSPTRISYKDNWSKVEAVDAVNAINLSGGISCLNHIGDLVNKIGIDQLEELIKLLINCGLQAYEVSFGDRFHLSIQKEAESILKKYNLIPIYGSDCHSCFFNNNAPSIDIEIFYKEIIRKKREFVALLDNEDQKAIDLLEYRANCISLKKVEYHHDLSKVVSTISLKTLFSIELGEKLISDIVTECRIRNISIPMILNRIDYRSLLVNESQKNFLDILSLAVWQMCYRLGLYHTGENLFDSFQYKFNLENSRTWEHIWNDFLKKHYKLDYLYLESERQKANNLLEKSLQNYFSKNSFRIESRIKSAISCWIKLYECWIKGKYAKIPESEPWCKLIENLLFNYPKYEHNKDFQVLHLSYLIPDLIGFRIIIDEEFEQKTERELITSMAKKIFCSIYCINDIPRRKHHKRTLIWGTGKGFLSDFPLEIQIKNHHEYFIGRAFYWHSKGVMTFRKNYLSEFHDFNTNFNKIDFNLANEEQVHQRILSIIKL